MNLPLTIRVTLSLIVFVAAITDLRSRRIPNWLTLPALPIGITAQTVYGNGFWEGLVGALAGLLALFPLFAVGAGGAGDIKLFAVVGAFTGPRNLLIIFVLVALIGGLAAIMVSWRARALGRVLTNAASILSSFLRLRWTELREKSELSGPGRIRLAYGAVIAAGTLVFLWYPR